MAISEKTILQVLIRDRALLLSRIDAIVRDPHLAEDVFQELSIQVLDQRENLKDEQHLVRWLRQAARHRAIDAYRGRSRQPMFLSDDIETLIDEQWGRLSTDDAQEMNDALMRCISRLSDYNRRLIELRYRENLTGRRLAEMLDRRINTVKVALTRVHRALLNCVEQQLRQEVRG
mgnify:CR=1 FL=1